MAKSPSPRPKSGSWLVIFGIFSVILLVFMLTLAYVILIGFRSVGQTPTPTATVRNPALALPTASVATPISGLPTPEQVNFIAEEPIKGFSNCEGYGVYGTIKSEQGRSLPGVQVVVWDDAAGLLGLNSTNEAGFYSIDLDEDLALHKLWVQIYENDLPISQPVLIEPQIDCQSGFQVYEIHWRRVE